MPLRQHNGGTTTANGTHTREAASRWTFERCREGGSKRKIQAQGRLNLNLMKMCNKMDRSNLTLNVATSRF